jgi:hypothetical protein
VGLMRRAIAREEQARQKAMEEQRRTVESVCIDVGDRRLDHCGCPAGEGSGRQPAVGRPPAKPDCTHIYR